MDQTEGQIFDLTVRVNLLEQRAISDYQEILEAVTDVHQRLDVLPSSLDEVRGQVLLLRFLLSHVISQADTTDVHATPLDLESLD